MSETEREGPTSTTGLLLRVLLAGFVEAIAWPIVGSPLLTGRETAGGRFGDWLRKGNDVDGPASAVGVLLRVLYAGVEAVA